jgi:branched-chain amino acid transport system permease protein
LLLATVIAIDGLIYASWLFIVALGLTLVFGVMKILNVAHGSFYAIGAYAAATLLGVYFSADNPPVLSFIVLILAAVAAGIPLGIVIERGVLRFMYGRDEVVLALVTYAIFLIFEDLILLVWGTDAYFAAQPATLLGQTDLGVLSFSNYDLSLILAAAVTGGLLWWALTRTRTGKILRAVIHDREISAAMGVNVGRMFTVTFAVGAVLGALGGALTAPIISVAPGIGVEIIVLAFAVVVIGGLGSIPGALIGALLVGLARASAVHLLPQVELFVIYGVMTLVLIVRPYGLFARAQARRI